MMEEIMTEVNEEIAEIPKLKNLANCTPREFLVQTNKIRKAAKNWMDITKIMDIRKNLPHTEGMSEAEKETAFAEQWNKNVSDMLDAALEANVEETVALLCMLCFVDPEDEDKYPVSAYLGAFSEIISCQEVISFFISLMQLGQTAGFGSAKA